MDNILMQGLRFETCHGVLPHEHVNPQPFIIDITLGLDLKPAGTSDDLNRTVSYDQAYHIVKKLVTENRFDLIETIAHRVAVALLDNFPPVMMAEVTVKKPKAPVEGDFDYFAARVTRYRRRLCYVALGSNLGDRLSYLEAARSLISEVPETEVTKTSSVYETAPWGKEDQPAFLNQVVEVATSLSPFRLLTHLLDIERDLGRVREEKWGPRTIDLDLLWYEGYEINTERLILPHPLLEERLFVLYPLAELNPDLIIAGGKSAKEALQLLVAKEGSHKITRL